MLMLSLYRHTLVAGRVLLLFFVLANTGFTVVLDYCIMGSMVCCIESDTAKDDPCCATQHSHRSGDLTISGTLGCHSTELVGGLNSNPTLVESRPVMQGPKVDTPSPFAAGYITAHFSTHLPTFRHDGSLHPFPTSVETYVLNSSFLI